MRPWSAQSRMGHLYRVPSLQSSRSLQTAGLAEEVEELGVVETAGKRCFSDTTEPLSQEFTAAATVGPRVSQMQPVRIPSIVMGCSQSPTPIWGVTLINGWEKSRFSTGMWPLRGHPCFSGISSTSGFSGLFILKYMKLGKGREGMGELGRG